MVLISRFPIHPECLSPWVEWDQKVISIGNNPSHVMTCHMSMKLLLTFLIAETKEEKKKRKAAVKEAKRDRRIEKKETRAAFAQEFQEESRKVTTQTIRLN